MADIVLSFSTAEAAKYVGMVEYTLDYWAKSGIATPSVSEGKGSGNPRKWSFSDLVGLKAIQELRLNKVPLQKVRNVLPKLKEATTEEENLKALAKSQFLIMPDGGLLVIISGQEFDAAEGLSRMRAYSVQHAGGKTVLQARFVLLESAVNEVGLALMSDEGAKDKVEYLRQKGVLKAA